jgi:hypothetical protein
MLALSNSLTPLQLRLAFPPLWLSHPLVVLRPTF